MFGIAVMVRVPQFEKPCSTGNGIMALQTSAVFTI